MTDELDSAQTKQQATTADWKPLVAKYQEPSTPRAVWQMTNTFGPLVALWVLIFLSLKVSWWLTAPLAAFAGIILVRVFIIFHDCGHGSYLKSGLANDIVGFICGMLTFTPYFHWRWEHSVHHSSAGHLDKRGTGDVYTMTVQEYLESSRWKRFAYQLSRNPIVLFVIAPLFLFLIRQRFASPKANRREKNSVHWMNLAIFGMAVGLSFVVGFWNYVLIQLIMMMVAGSVGIWMFYVQHQFEEAYWERDGKWDYTAAALQGSSFYKLPKILQWFSGNIGFHHIHHLSPKIPNYNLERCHKAHSLFQQVKPITLFSSLKTASLRLWDEQDKKLVGYRHLRKIRHEQSVAQKDRR